MYNATLEVSFCGTSTIDDIRGLKVNKKIINAVMLRLLIDYKLCVFCPNEMGWACGAYG